MKRQQQRRDEMRRDILDAARHLFIEGGYANVPIRRVAAQLEYSPAALYRYFPTKDDIFNELADEGFRLLMTRETLPAGPEDASPIQRLRHFFWGVFDFAKLYPEYFYLIFLDRSAPRLKPDSRGIRSLTEIYPQIGDMLDDCVAAGELRPGLDPVTVYFVMTSAIHGVAAQYVCNRLGEGVDPDAYAHVVIDLAIAGLQAGVLDGVRVTSGDCDGTAAGAGRQARPVRRRRPAANRSARARRRPKR
jgi:AcrR family transcriptional regulator